MPPPQPMDGMAPPPQDMRQPINGMRSNQMPGNGRRPMRPETMKMLISLLVIGLLWGIMYFIRNLKTERKNRELRIENQRNQDKIEELNRAADNAQKADSELIFKTDYKQVRIKPDDILYIEGMAEYLKINKTGSPTPLIVHLSMKRLLEQLPDDRFMRIHKSYIVNLNRITDTYRKLFAERFGTPSDGLVNTVGNNSL